MNKPSLAPRFLYIFCAGYALSLFIDPAGNLLPYLSMGMILLGLYLGMISASKGSPARIIFLITLILPLAAINSIVSSNPTDSSLKWLCWLAVLLGMYLLSQRCGPSVEEALCKNTAPAFLIIWAYLALKGNSTTTTGRENQALHLSAFYANLLICSGMFFTKKNLRIILVILGIIGALTSGSRAAFLFLPFVFIPSIIYYYKFKFSSISLVLLLMGLLFIIFSNDTLNALTFGRKLGNNRDFDSIEMAERSGGGRAELRKIGFDYIKDKPWGYGYGQSFDVVLDGKSMGNNLHNGFLNVAAQMGVHIFLIYMTFTLWLYYNLITNRTISRRLRYFILSILSCVFLRALSESFSLFDLGHPASFFCIFLISLFVTRLRSKERYFA